MPSVWLTLSDVSPHDAIYAHPTEEAHKSVYLKVVGSGGTPLPGPYVEPYAEFPPSRPPDNISKGDFLVLYAAGARY